MNSKLINSRIYLLVLPLIVLFVFNGKKYDAAVIDRINIPVRVCIQGEDCGAPLISASDMLVDSKGTKLYAGCIACHGTGGEGGIGPSFTGRSVDYISAALIQYKNNVKFLLFFNSSVQFKYSKKMSAIWFIAFHIERTNMELKKIVYV